MCIVVHIMADCRGELSSRPPQRQGGLGTWSALRLELGDGRKERESMLAAVFQAPPRRAHRKLDANTGVVQTSLQEVLNAYSLSKFLR